MKGWQITDATADDAGPLARILGDWARETGWMPVLHSRAEDMAFVAMLIRDRVVRVARDGDEGIGFLARSGGEVTALYLAPHGRGRGIGTALLNEAKAGEDSLSLWTFQANARAVAFYQREGFREILRSDGRTNAEGLPDIRLQWRQDL